MSTNLFVFDRILHFRIRQFRDFIMLTISLIEHRKLTDASNLLCCPKMTCNLSKMKEIRANSLPLVIVHISTLCSRYRRQHSQIKHASTKPSSRRHMDPSGPASMLTTSATSITGWKSAIMYGRNHSQEHWVFDMLWRFRRKFTHHRSYWMPEWFPCRLYGRLDRASIPGGNWGHNLSNVQRYFTIG